MQRVDDSVKYKHVKETNNQHKEHKMKTTNHPSRSSNSEWVQLQVAQTAAMMWLRGKFDKAGNPVSLHAIEMAQDFLREGSGLLVAPVAMLHDVFEDSDTTEKEMIEHLRYPATSLDGQLVVDIVKTLTRHPEESYASYIYRVVDHDVAVRVKIADIKHHLKDTTAIPESLVGRYEKALRILEGLD